MRRARAAWRLLHHPDSPAFPGEEPAVLWLPRLEQRAAQPAHSPAVAAATARVQRAEASARTAAVYAASLAAAAGLPFRLPDQVQLQVGTVPLDLGGLPQVGPVQAARGAGGWQGRDRCRGHGVGRRALQSRTRQARHADHMHPPGPPAAAVGAMRGLAWCFIRLALQPTMCSPRRNCCRLLTPSWSRRYTAHRRRSRMRRLQHLAPLQGCWQAHPAHWPRPMWHRCRQQRPPLPATGFCHRPAAGGWCSAPDRLMPG